MIIGWQGPLRAVLLSILAIFCCVITLQAQTYRVTGRVVNEKNGEPIAFANVIFKGTLVGTVTDTAGYFKLEARKPHDSLKISAVGFKTRVVAARFDGQSVHVTLTPATIEIGPVVVKAGENPAFRILRRVHERKPFHSLEGLDYYQYEAYNKMEFDIHDFDKRLTRNFLLKPIDFIFEYTDTTQEGKSVLPVFISEAISDVYYRREPKAKREYIKGSKFSGVQNPKLVQILGQMGFYVDIYEDFNVIFNKNFPSPLNPALNLYYRYYLDDSLHIDGRLTYLINFKPRNDRDVAFEGTLLIDAQDYAVKDVDMRFSEKGNINFVRAFRIKQVFERIDSAGRWYLSKNALIADLTVLEKEKNLMGVLARKTTTYRKVRLNQPADPQYYGGVDDVIVLEGADTRDENFWREVRHEALVKREENIYKMVDSLNRNKYFRFLKESVRVIGSGYARVGKFDIGNIHSFVSWNPSEGWRGKIGARTNRFLSKYVESNAWVAYGFRDQTVKYGAELVYFPLSMFRRRHNVGLSYKFDMEQIGLSNNALPVDHFMTALFRTGPFDRLTLTKEGILWYEHNWFAGFVTRLSLIYRDVAPRGTFRFLTLNPQGDLTEFSSLQNAELRFNLRFAFRERVLSSDFRRRVFINKYPVVAAEVGKGFQNILSSDFNFLRAKLQINHRLRISKLGYIDYMLEGGRTWGQVPYYMMEIHTANQTIINDEAAFNLMRFYEFVSDRYFAFYMENHFEGFFFNRIPLIRKLKWREFLVNKILIGYLDPQNRNKPLIFPDGLGSLNPRVPYWETGFGLENLFKVLRIDFLWRVTYRSSDAFGLGWAIKPSLYLRF